MALGFTVKFRVGLIGLGPGNDTSGRISAKLPSLLPYYRYDMIRRIAVTVLHSALGSAG